MKDRYGESFSKLLKIVQRLLGPQGCPWDRLQTLDTLKPYIIEEVYEVIEAVEKKDPQQHKEELGDLLLQILFHAEIERKKGVFDIENVINSLINKLIQRHPHVFGDLKVKGEGEVLQNWERLKRKEGKSSVLQGIPKSIPALLKAFRVTEKAARVGFDWNHLSEVQGKVQEELNELNQAIKKREPKQIEHEIGDLLFAVVNLARFLKTDPESALRIATSRFITRFEYIESVVQKRGQKLEDYSLEELDKLWQEAKLTESPSKGKI
jgi:MazG family protein